MNFDVDIGHASHRGPRPQNEDFVAAMRPPAGDEPLGLVAAIADGVSAGGEGRMAAQTSVLSVVEDFFGAPATWDTTVVLDRLIGAQNSWLVAHNRRSTHRSAMTTLTAVVLRGQSWTLAHLGDTRAYLLRAGECRRLTQDHALDHIDLRSQLTRAMGLDDTVHVDYLQGDLHLGDAFLLLSDGVHATLAGAQIQALAAQGTAQEACDALVNAAVAAGTPDNASALVLRVKGLARARLEDSVLRSGRLPVPRRMKVGDVIDGQVVTALVADTSVHLLYQVRNSSTGELRALKTLHPSRAGDRQERAMLAHEAWLGERVTEHVSGGGESGFVRLIKVAAPSEFYLLYEWHAGQTLARALSQRGARGSLAVADVVAWGLSAARSLGRLHRLGVIHRDVKPDNLHLGDDGQLRLLDLGVALSGNEPPEQRGLHAGTPSYMNPELWDGAVADSRSDLFALGVTLYQLLTGHLPYGEIEPYQKLRYRRDPKPLSRQRPDVPIWLDHVVLKALARDPKLRFETAEELALALDRGASRPLSGLPASPLLARDPTALWQISLAVSVLFNLLLVYWLLALPR